MGAACSPSGTCQVAVESVGVHQVREPSVPRRGCPLSCWSVRASWVRLLTPSLRRWYSTVLALRNSRAAISRLVRCPATSRAICSSCGVSTAAAPGRRRHFWRVDNKRTPLMRGAIAPRVSKSNRAIRAPSLECSFLVRFRVHSHSLAQATVCLRVAVLASRRGITWNDYPRKVVRHEAILACCTGDAGDGAGIEWSGIGCQSASELPGIGQLELCRSARSPGRGTAVRLRRGGGERRPGGSGPERVLPRSWWLYRRLLVPLPVGEQAALF